MNTEKNHNLILTILSIEQKKKTQKKFLFGFFYYNGLVAKHFVFLIISEIIM